MNLTSCIDNSKDLNLTNFIDSIKDLNSTNLLLKIVLGTGSAEASSSSSTLKVSTFDVEGSVIDGRAVAEDEAETNDRF